jgi:hypothetical protein
MPGLKSTITGLLLLAALLFLALAIPGDPLP